MSEQSCAIGELSSRTGVAASALRYYEELGLIPPVPRTSGQRCYPVATVDVVGTIVLLRQVGFSLEEIKALVRPGGSSSRRWRTTVRQKVIELDEQIARAGVGA